MIAQSILARFAPKTDANTVARPRNGQQSVKRMEDLLRFHILDVVPEGYSLQLITKALGHLDHGGS